VRRWGDKHRYQIDISVPKGENKRGGKKEITSSKPFQNPTRQTLLDFKTYE